MTFITFVLIFFVNLNDYYVRAHAQLYEGNNCELYDGSLGVCKSLEYCKWAIDRLQKGEMTFADIRRTTCSYVGTHEIVCCGDERPIVQSTTLPLPPKGDKDEIVFFPDFGNYNEHENPSRTNPFQHTTQTTIKSINPFWNQWSPLKKVPSDTISFGEHISGRHIDTPTISSNEIHPSDRINWERLTNTSTFNRTSLHGNKQEFNIQSFNATPTFSVNKTKKLTDMSDNNTLLLLTTTSTTENSVLPIILSTSASTILNSTISSPTTTSATVVTMNTTSWPLGTLVTPTTSTPQVIFYPTDEDDMITADTNYYPLQNISDVINPGGGNSTNLLNIVDGQSNNNDLYPAVTRTTSKPVDQYTTPTPTRIANRKSETACIAYSTLSSPFLSFQILGGVPTTLGEFPHMAALGFPSEEINKYEYDFECGGSLISELYVLTAAHCVKARNQPTVVRMGKVTLHTNDDGTDGVTANIAEIIPHPDYKRSQRYNDIALIRLVTPVTFSNTIRPACLRTNMSDIDPSVELYVTGWGSTSVRRAERSEVLLKTNITSVPLQFCNRSLLEYDSHDRSFRRGIIQSQLCAYDPQARNDACQGDSGGPLQIYDASGVSTIVGITSFGVACGSLIPSVYTRVAYYLDWIEPIVWPNL